ncbi:MAG: nuclear transport factor 2 family protein [Planctomycetota bacterium]
MTTEMESVICEETLAVGKKLVELCNAGNDKEVLDTYYADDIVSEEVATMPGTGLPRVSEGIEAVRAKWQWWYDNNEIHSGSCTGPFPHGNKFIVIFEMDTTAKTGPMAGQRMQMQEAALYTVKDGKIVHEQFFYDMGGC